MRIRKIFITFSVVCFVSVGLHAQSIEVIPSKTGLDLAFDHVVRMSGGFPYSDKANSDTLITTDHDNFSFGTSERSIDVSIKRSHPGNSIGIFLNPQGYDPVSHNEFIGFFFTSIPGYKQGVTFYRYKPWNAWTKPKKVHSPGDLESWDNQCFYWQYEDGLYGAAVPLSHNGYRATLGSENGKFGSKAYAYVDGYSNEPVPAMVIAFDTDPYKLLTEIYGTAMTFMGTPENIVSKKKFPEQLEYLGWCTWNASSNGTNLNEQTVIRGVESFTKNNFPLGWVLIDDGWFDHNGQRLRSFRPDAAKFPNGFAPMINTLKKQYNLKHVGVWHALNGYWNGIDPDSPLGKRYASQLFSWSQRERPDIANAPLVTYHFIKPGSDSLKSFYRNFHRYLKSEGFSFVKVDNQLVVERMSVNNYPINTLAKTMHEAMNASVQENFNNGIINCMDMTADAYFNFGTTAVGRSVEDYFPYQEDETYNLQKGNAAAHVLQGVYNNLYFSQMVFPDLDMFQSHNPNGEFHAIARAINNGPIYVTDNPGDQNFEILNKLVLDNGKILRSQTPLLPTEDCLFQVQDKKPFKAFSLSNGVGLLGIWNCADAEEVTGKFSAIDIEGLKGDQFVLYDFLTGKLSIVDKNDEFPVTLGRLKYQLYYFAPLEQGIAVLGLVNKYNAAAAIETYKISEDEVNIILKGGGTLAVYLSSEPKKIKAGTKTIKEFDFENGLLTVDVSEEKSGTIAIKITR